MIDKNGVRLLRRKKRFTASAMRPPLKKVKTPKMHRVPVTVKEPVVIDTSLDEPVEPVVEEFASPMLDFSIEEEKSVDIVEEKENTTTDAKSRLKKRSSKRPSKKD